jgi:hypothetical protein
VNISVPPTFYLLTLLGDVEPQLSAPLDSPDQVLEMARAHRRIDHEDGLYYLEVFIENGKPRAAAYPFTGGVLESGL